MTTRFRPIAPARRRLHDLDEAAEAGRSFGRLGVYEEDGGPARPGAGRGVDDALALGPQRLESRLRVADTEGDVDETSATAALRDLAGHRRRVGEWLEQLHGPETIAAGREQDLADLVGAADLLAVPLAEAEAAPRGDVSLERAGGHRDRHVIEPEPAGNASGIERRNVEARRQHEAQSNSPWWKCRGHRDGRGARHMRRDFHHRLLRHNGARRRGGARSSR